MASALYGMKIPLSNLFYNGAKEKYLARITSDPNLTKSIATIVPRMSFDLVGMDYDSSRKQMSTLQNFAANNATKFNSQYAPIPYNFDFTLSMICAIFPSSSIKKVVRKTPMYFLPYMLFSPHTPYFSKMAWSVSANK